MVVKKADVVKQEDSGGVAFSKEGNNKGGKAVECGLRLTPFLNGVEALITE